MLSIALLSILSVSSGIIVKASDITVKASDITVEVSDIIVEALAEGSSPASKEDSSCK